MTVPTKMAFQGQALGNPLGITTKKPGTGFKLYKSKQKIKSKQNSKHLLKTRLKPAKSTFSSIRAVIAIEEAPLECSDARAEAGNNLLSESLENNVTEENVTREDDNE